MVSSNANSSGSGEVIAPIPMPAAPAAQGARDSEDEVAQPEQELTPQVSTQEPEPLTSREAPEVERDLAAPSVQGPSPGEPVELPHLDASNIPVPESDEGLFSEEVMLSSQVLDDKDFSPDELITFSSLVTNEEYSGPPLAEDNLPFVEHPLACEDHQAYCLEITVKPKDLKRWSQEAAPEQLATLASISKRARSEVSVKDLSPHEVSLFEQAKAKELQCWIQTSAIRSILRRRLNPDQILKSRWILTWKTPEPGESQPRAKARLVVLGFQDPS